MSRIPIKVAREIAKKYGLSHVIIFAHQKEPYLDYIVTYGKSLNDCDQAAQFGDILKDALEWPEKLKILPSRVHKYKNRIEELEEQIRAAQLCVETESGRARVDVQGEDLKEALKEAIEWLEQAPFDYSNGVDAFGQDEGSYYGWKAHQEMVNRFKKLLGLPVSDAEEFIEKINNKLPDDDFPF